MKKMYAMLIIALCLYGCSATSKETISKEPKEISIPEEIKPDTTPVAETPELDIQKTEVAPPSENIEVEKVDPLYVKNILYTGKLPELDYLFTPSRANMRETATVKGNIVGKTTSLTKIHVLEKVDGEGIKGNTTWYKVDFNGKIGYIHSSVVAKREFRFDEMAKKIEKLDIFIKDSKDNNLTVERIIEYVPGEKEKVGIPVDPFGERGEQSVVATYDEESFRYISDGRIVSVRESTKNGDTITIPDSDNLYHVKNLKAKKINLEEGIDKVIVIDLKNQNQGIFQRIDGAWNLISYALVTTGRNDHKRSYETPKGHFLVGNTVRQVIFPHKTKVKRDDGSGYDTIVKYSRADYGVRFSGGGYIHGIPLSDDIMDSLGSKKAIKKRKENNEIILGTYKSSHKCVRNPDEHQNFLYHEFVGYDPKYEGKWWRAPKENVAVIVFD